MIIIQTPVRFFPALGGVENHVLYLGKELVSQGAQVSVICSNEPPSTKKQVQGIRVHRLSYPFKVTNTNITLSLPFVLLRTAFDVMHTHMPTPWSCDWSILIAKLKRKPAVMTIHNDMQKPGAITKIITDIYLQTVFRVSLALADRIIIVNPDWEEAFHYTRNLLLPHKNKISVLPNGVDTNLFTPKPTKKEYDILFVSILDEHHVFKGLDYLIEAIAQMVKSKPKLKVCIVGEGELKKKHIQQAKDLGVLNNIDFVGEVKQKNLPEYFRKSKVFVLPSIDTEGYGIVLLEAMACGTPVVTTSIAGVASDITKHHTGLVVKPKKVAALIAAITIILGDSALQNKMSKNARKLIEEEYSWKKIAEKILQFYKTL